MKLLELIVISTLKIFSKHRKRLLSSGWSSEEWLKTYHNLKRKSLQKTRPSLMKKKDKKATRERTSHSKTIKKKSKEISKVQKKWSRRKRVILLVSNMSSVRLNLKNKSRRKIMKWLLMSETSLVLSWSRETKNCHCCTRRSKFRKVLLTKVRFITRRDWTILWVLGSKSLTWRDSWLCRRMRHLAFQIWREKSICSKRNISSNNRKPSTSMTSYKSHSTFTDGGNSNALIQKPTKTFKRSSPSKKDWLPKLRKFQKKMYWSKKKKSCTLN